MNILAAIDAWLKLVPIAIDMRDMNVPMGMIGPSESIRALARGHAAFHETNSPLRPHDVGLHSNERKMTLAGRFEHAGHRVEIEIYIDIGIPGKPSLDRRIVVDDLTLDEGSQYTPAQYAKLTLLQSIAWERAFSLVPADRMPRTETPTDKPLERPPANSEPVSWYFRRGQLKDALFAAQNSDSAETARALERFRRFMTGPPLHRRPFRVVENPSSGVRDVREWLGPPLEQHDISLDFAGLGIAQIYWILGQGMLSGAYAIGIEEPEAHLHAPTTGRDLRQLLGRLVSENHIEQLFVATHSGGHSAIRSDRAEKARKLRQASTVARRASRVSWTTKRLRGSGPGYT